MKAIKVLVSAYEASGKTTITSKIKDALVINFDRKEYGFNVPHANFTNYEGMGSVCNFINEKIKKYKENFNSLPKVVILDTVTQLYSAMARYNGAKYTGFNIHSQNNSDTLDFNAYVEEVLIANGISVVIVAHTTVDPDSGRHIIPASGQFSKAGSWLSVVNDAIFIEKASGKLVVHFKGFKYPTRTTLKDMPDKVEIENFDINEYINKLINSKTEADKFVL